MSLGQKKTLRFGTVRLEWKTGLSNLLRHHLYLFELTEVGFHNCPDHGGTIEIKCGNKTKIEKK